MKEKAQRPKSCESPSDLRVHNNSETVYFSVVAENPIVSLVSYLHRYSKVLGSIRNWGRFDAEICGDLKSSHTRCPLKVAK
jgi:hypothetical protein